MFRWLLFLYSGELPSPDDAMVHSVDSFLTVLPDMGILKIVFIVDAV
jgi:hypothetical protein